MPASLVPGLALLAALGGTPAKQRPALNPSECVDCHRAETEAWSRSPHARSRINALFVASFARSRLRWCLDCHAPRLQDDRARQSSIDCAVCHVRDGAVLTSHAPTIAGLRAHRMTEAPSLGAVAACQGCHQFNAPAAMQAPLHFTATPMQDTVGEWSRGPMGRAGTPCQSCHMAAGNHDLEGGHDVDLLRRTVAVEVVPVDGGYAVALRAHGAGHEVPTGDPFRRFELEVRSANSDATVAVRRFGRTLGDRTDGGWQVIDTAAPTPGAGTSVSPAQVIATPPAGASWVLTYRRDEPELEGTLPEAEYEVEVTRGAFGPR